MPAMFGLLYHEYCRARFAEMRKLLLISLGRHEVPKAIAMQMMLSALVQRAS
jgi:hypothetical protein